MYSVCNGDQSKGRKPKVKSFLWHEAFPAGAPKGALPMSRVLSRLDTTHEEGQEEHDGHRRDNKAINRKSQGPANGRTPAVLEPLIDAPRTGTGGRKRAAGISCVVVDHQLEVDGARAHPLPTGARSPPPTGARSPPPTGARSPPPTGARSPPVGNRVK